MSILDRKAEFGFLRANGESRAALLRLVLVESLLLGGVGAVLGVTALWALNGTLLAGGLEMPAAPGFTRPFTFHLALAGDRALVVMALTVATAAVATVLAAVKVLRLDIAASIRTL